MVINWKKRGAYVLGSFITGYGGGLGTVFGMDAVNQWTVDIHGIFLIPAIAGVIVALPQLGKIITEYSNSED